MSTVILWLRRDLRLHDLPALGAAHEAGSDILPVFVLDPALLGDSSVRTHVLFGALRALNDSYDGALVLRTGKPEEVIPKLVAEVGANSVHITLETTPFGRRRDERVRDALGETPLIATGSPYAIGPGTIFNGSGDPYKVFTPFSKAWRAHGWPRPAEVPADLTWRRGVDSEQLPDAPDLPEGMGVDEVSEAAAHDRWEEFSGEAVADYKDQRDLPSTDGTSRLSAQLKYGTIHPRTLLADLGGREGDGIFTFVSELAWREFYADVLWHNPSSVWTDLRQSLAAMPYDHPDDDPDTADLVDAWRAGKTGYPFVDAGMRQLLADGWMHNRVRMVTASFLVKHLHVWWPVGARHFMEHLIDGDIASNNHGWQWVAGTGTDAAPYFRVFNPITQGKRFDPNGDYIRRYVPELRHLDGKSVHEPWKALDGQAHGYPDPIVEHSAARSEALSRYEQAREEQSGGTS
ncbi:DNA photolyase family protein [Ornithinimicrobium sp. Arc0846-15]|nr:DNA photolyase family protein [Ornithinimicrobium laminariae]